MKNKFYVLLAGDSAGKSTVLDRINELENWKLVTYDKEYVPDEYDMISVINKHIADKTLALYPILHQDFKTSLYSVYIYYLHALVEKYIKEGNVICNSYYYKILAKELLQDGENSKFHDLWRTLPKPDKIIYLDTPPDLAAKRLGDLNKLVANEHYGAVPTLENFISYQSALKEKMLLEAQDVKVEMLDGTVSKEEVWNSFTKMI